MGKGQKYKDTAEDTEFHSKECYVIIQYLFYLIPIISSQLT